MRNGSFAGAHHRREIEVARSWQFALTKAGTRLSGTDRRGTGRGHPHRVRLAICPLFTIEIWTWLADFWQDRRHFVRHAFARATCIRAIRIHLVAVPTDALLVNGTCRTFCKRSLEGRGARGFEDIDPTLGEDFRERAISEGGKCSDTRIGVFGMELDGAIVNILLVFGYFSLLRGDAFGICLGAMAFHGVRTKCLVEAIGEIREGVGVATAGCRFAVTAASSKEE